MKDPGKQQPLTNADQELFHDLYQLHHRRVYSICLRMTQDISDAEDLTHEVFVQLFRTIGSFRGESAFSTWLHRLTVNHVLMYFRKNKRRLQSEQLTESLEALGRLAAGSKRTSIVDRILLSEVIAKLPEGYREALILHDIHGLDHKEIARRKGRTEGTSKSQLHKAKVTLRALITQPASVQA